MLNHRFLNSILEIDEHTWDTLWSSDYPFTRYAFLAALESSACTGSESGWLARHLIVYDDSVAIAAFLLFEKNHSYGEYVFDWSWADAYHQNGLSYYPKLISAAPFTPATGPRLALSPSLTDQQKQETLAYSLEQITGHCQAHNLSSFHCLFPSAGNAQAFKTQQTIPLLARQGCQFHWFNRDYSDFQHFLSYFTSRKRKSVLRERRKVSESGLTIAMVEGKEMLREDWQTFYRLYEQTYLKRSGHSGYLNENFFLALGETFADQVLIAKAFKNEAWIAGALYFKDQNTLYGRYWGSLAEYDGLHFECCYYQGIEYAIKHHLQKFDPGAQGEHKIQRGFEPTLTSSYHWIADVRFQSAIADFLAQETQHVHHYANDTRSYLPFKQAEP